MQPSILLLHILLVSDRPSWLFLIRLLPVTYLIYGFFSIVTVPLDLLVASNCQNGTIFEQVICG